MVEALGQEVPQGDMVSTIRRWATSKIIDSARSTTSVTSSGTL